ncbi:MAG: hypothetical protein O3B01_11845 [Planctomycetota bacterium]|nr:hypothetical protein [Planctomycetota bacterium]MDA1139268.1 hypothetical protein [Planctomycetota bacterium]
MESKCAERPTLYLIWDRDAPVLLKHRPQEVRYQVVGECSADMLAFVAGH